MVSDLPVMNCWWTGWRNTGWNETGKQTVQNSGTIILTVLVKQTSVSKAINDSLPGTYKLSDRRVIVKTHSAKKKKKTEPNMFSNGSWFRVSVSRYLNFFSSFTHLHTCWTATIVISYPVCEGGGQICSHFLSQNVQHFILLTAFCQCSLPFLILLGQQCRILTWWGLRVTPMKMSKRQSLP